MTIVTLLFNIDTFYSELSASTDTDDIGLKSMPRARRCEKGKVPVFRLYRGILSNSIEGA